LTSEWRPRQLSAQRVFLCHSSADKPVVQQLYGRLLADGFRPWLDEEDLVPGQDWEYEIRKAITASDIILVCLSGESVTRTGYVQKEIRIALDAADERPEGSIFVIPACLEPCALPERLRRWHRVDLYKDDGYRKLRGAIDSVYLKDWGRSESYAKNVVQSPTPRFDGLYVKAEEGEDYTRYIRFFSSGTACTVSSPGRVRDVMRWLLPNSNPIIPEGKYTLSENRIRIRVEASNGVVEYSGTISTDATELRLHTHSYINGHESFGVWRFERAQDIQLASGAVSRI
jgi:hypothetical protein